MAHALLPDSKALTLDTIAVQAGKIVFQIHTTEPTAACPECGGHSERVHSHYQRTLQDLPWQGNTVRFLLTVRRFFCDNAVITVPAPVRSSRKERKEPILSPSPIAARPLASTTCFYNWSGE